MNELNFNQRLKPILNIIQFSLFDVTECILVLILPFSVIPHAVFVWALAIVMSWMDYACSQAVTHSATTTVKLCLTFAVSVVSKMFPKIVWFLMQYLHGHWLNCDELNGLCLLPGSHPSCYYHSQTMFNFCAIRCIQFNNWFAI